MAAEEFEVSEVIPAPPDRIYSAFLSSDGHTAMTGGKAVVNAIIGHRFTAWDGYIEGKNVELEPNRRIVQTWRTSEFESASPDSKVEFRLEPVSDGTRVTVRHTNLPAGQGESYRIGWDEHYFQPMKRYFANALQEIEDTDISGVRDTLEHFEETVSRVAPVIAKTAAAAVVRKAKSVVKKAKAAVRTAGERVGLKKKKKAAPARKKAATASAKKKKAPAARKKATPKKKAAARAKPKAKAKAGAKKTKGSRNKK